MSVLERQIINDQKSFPTALIIHSHAKNARDGYKKIAQNPPEPFHESVNEIGAVCEGGRCGRAGKRKENGIQWGKNLSKWRK